MGLANFLEELGPKLGIKGQVDFSIGRDWGAGDRRRGGIPGQTGRGHRIEGGGQESKCFCYWCEGRENGRVCYQNADFQVPGTESGTLLSLYLWGQFP